ncbi:MAG TPA: VWA domain-containing protein [Candidatus Eisenbacteria bacterium]|jgi:VWFA-related protein|nr:VWA domain-containing protein [Candidatus Eisenbacteria bacterium]
MHRRSQFRRLLLVLYAGSACSLAAQSPSGPISPQAGTAIQQAPRQPKIGVRVALVNTPVTVRDSKGQMVHTLDIKDFHVTDNGVSQKITHFDMGGDPLSLVILVETSSRIAAFLPQMRKSGILFTQTVMGADAEAAVVGFNDSVDKLQDFTSNPDQIDSTINHLKAGTSGTKLYDAMALGVEMLSGRPQPSADQPGRRRVMFLMSEATDIGSGSKFGEVLRQAQLSNITIYSVGLSTTRAELQAAPRDTTPHPTPPGTFGAPPFPGTPQGLESDSARYGSGDLTQAIAWVVKNVADKIKGNPLELASAGTGGAHLPTFKDRSIETAIDEIGGELHSQYSVSYTPTGTNDTGYHEIKVAVDGKNLKVRARPGYYIAPPAS